MDPYKMRSIVVMNLFYNITIGALKYIKHIKHHLAPKHMNLWANWYFHKSPPIIKAFIITFVTLSLFNPLIIWSKEMRIGILTQVCIK
jgi:p-aminobenzoyl-glutamate transporter AbgT